MSGFFESLNEEASKVVERGRAGLVQVVRPGGGAAGTIWHPEGLVITNAHVVGNGPVRVVLPEGRSVGARVLAIDTGLDIAALAVDASGLPTVALGDSRALRPGELVIAVGHPWGVLGAATSGVVVGVGDEWPEGPLANREWVVVNLHLRPGYSGGPLMDSEGRLVGMNTVMTAPDLGMAVPVHVVKAYLRETLGAPKVAV